MQVHGGVDLRLGNRSSPKHRRVPSEEALLKMAAQHNSPIPFPAVFSPIPEDYDSTVQQLQQQQQQQQQRPPSRTSQGTTFAERLNTFLSGVGSSRPAEANPFGQSAGFMATNNAQLSEARHAQMAVSGSNAGVAGDTTNGVTASAAGQSLESSPSLERVGSGAAASASGDLLDTAWDGPQGVHSAREKARAEAIAVYGERCDLQPLIKSSTDCLRTSRDLWPASFACAGSVHAFCMQSNAECKAVMHKLLHPSVLC